MNQVRRGVVIIVCFLMGAIVACDSKPSYKPNSLISSSNLQIEISSPYACYNEILMDSTWSGTSILSYGDSEQKKALKGKKKFVIRSDADRLKIISLLNRIKARQPVFSRHGVDLYHFTVNIDGRKYIDKYGQDSLLDDMRKSLLPYAEVEENGQCDFLYLFKQGLR